MFLLHRLDFLSEDNIFKRIVLDHHKKLTLLSKNTYKPGHINTFLTINSNTFPLSVFVFFNTLQQPH